MSSNVFSLASRRAGPEAGERDRRGVAHPGQRDCDSPWVPGALLQLLHERAARAQRLQQARPRVGDRAEVHRVSY